MPPISRSPTSTGTPAPASFGSGRGARGEPDADPAERDSERDSDRPLGRGVADSGSRLLHPHALARARRVGGRPASDAAGGAAGARPRSRSFSRPSRSATPREARAWRRPNRRRAPTAPAPTRLPPTREPTRAPTRPPASQTRTYAGTASTPSGKLELEGIVYSEANPTALINGRVVAPGGFVDGYTVISIERDRVELEGTSGRIILTLK